MRLLPILLAVLLLPAPSVAQQERIPSHCIALAEGVEGMRYLVPAAYGPEVPAGSVRLRYVDHAMFLLQTPGGIGIVTDYSGFLGPTDYVPDVVTMNRAHGTHWTPNPDPRVRHVLPGWNPAGPGPVDHHLDLGEILVRNVPTDIRSGYGGSIPGGNSIFVFEAEGLCIGHLGHLHHEPTPEQYAALGRLDVVMAPVDGGLTLPLPTMIRTLQRLRSSVVIPMHWFSNAALQQFLTGMQQDFRIVVTGESELDLSLRTLPSEPTVMVLTPRFLGADGPRP